MDFTGEEFRKVNSMTKYPAIETFHKIDSTNGQLQEELNVIFKGKVYFTEKIDGTNGRIIVFPDGDWIIGSREELLCAKGDRIWNSALGIVNSLHYIADTLAQMHRHDVPTVYYGEVYGHGINGKAAHNYTKNSTKTAFRLFDAVELDEFDDLIPQSREQIAGWRDRGGQRFLNYSALTMFAHDRALPQVPDVRSMNVHWLPSGVQEVYELLKESISDSLVCLDLHVQGRAEGLIARSHDRKQIAKIRFEDYERTMRKRGLLK